MGYCNQSTNYHFTNYHLPLTTSPITTSPITNYHFTNYHFIVPHAPVLRPDYYAERYYPEEDALHTTQAVAANGVQHSPIVTTELVVRFAETDAMGIVHHSAYIIWFEAARVAWMDAQGLPYADFAAAGNHFAVTGIDVAYRQSCRFGDVVQIETQITQLRSRQVTFAYKVRRAADGALLATGKSEHVCVDLAGRVATIPAAAMARLQQGLA